MTRSKTPQAVRGTQDIFGPDAERFGRVVATFDQIRRLYGFRPVILPVFEDTQVFSRSLGETTDVVSKEMYSFPDRSGDSLTLRPEFTAGIARAYLTNGWQQHAPLKLATHGPLFRYERPQKGRYRQFHQIDAEVLGAAEPQADVELLVMADQLLRELGIADGVTLTLNTLGDAPSRDAWRAALVAHFYDHAADLSEDSQRRLDSNPLRILDSKEAQDRPIADSAPDIDAFLTAEAQDFFGAVTAGLDAAGVAWTRNARLVRGLDYYRHTAFEFVTDRLGAQGTVLAGGRYDGLVESLGGPPTPGVGWAAGIERLAMLLPDREPEGPDVAIVPLDDAALDMSNRLARDLRSQHYAVELLVSGKVKKRMARASDAGALIAVMIGEAERAAGQVMVKDMVTGEQALMDAADVGEVAAQAQNARWLRGAAGDEGEMPEPDWP
jgi:histidyl-tRNA synthetase